MSPETYSTSENIELKAEIMKPALIEVEQEAQAIAHQHRQGMYPSIRERFDISENPVETSDLMDQRTKLPGTAISPELLTEVLPISSQSANTTRMSRTKTETILRGEEDRLVVIVGPCSIHDPKSALEYADFIVDQRKLHGDDLEIIMRFYTEKPRSVAGWKGLTYDPDLTEFLNPNNVVYDFNKGVMITRMLANAITHKGVPLAMERLNALTPQYVNGLVTYDAIGARNALDQKAREYASGTSSVVGIKHTPDGNISSAVDAVDSASRPHVLLGNEMSGVNAEIETTGNETAHVILRGSRDSPNYSEEYIQKTLDQIRERNAVTSRKLLEAVVVDASHDNSDKNYTKQFWVVKNVAEQIILGDTAIKGVMLESNLRSGKQSPPADGQKSSLEYGKSITDGCIDIKETEQLLGILAGAVKARRYSDVG